MNTEKVLTLVDIVGAVLLLASAIFIRLPFF